MKKVLSLLLIFLFSLILIPNVKAEGNYYEMKVYNIHSKMDLTETDFVIGNFLTEKNAFVDEDGYVYYQGKKVVHYEHRDGNIFYTIEDGVTVEDNYKYTFTEEDKELINSDDAPNGYNLLRGYDGISIKFVDDCEDNVCIKQTLLDSKSDTAIINNEPEIDGLSVEFDVSLKIVNDQVKYKIVIINNTSEEFKLNVNNFNKSDYIKYEYSFVDGNNIIKANSEKELFVTIKYENQVPYNQLEEGFVEKNVLVLTTNKDTVTNPKTGDINHIIIILSLIAVFSVLYITVSKKQTKLSLSIVLLLILIPIVSKAISELTIKVNTSVEIIGGSTLMERPMGVTEESNGKLKDAYINDADIWVFQYNIRTVTFQNKMKEPNTYEYKFDVSEEQDKSIMAYLVAVEGTQNFDLYIMSDGIIYANPDSSSWFSNMTMTTINGLEYLNTSKVENMTDLFAFCRNLTSLDLSHFDTSNVTLMPSMFYENSSLTSLDLSSFNTSKVTSMANMFTNCGELKSVNLTSFNTSKVTDMGGMFHGCKKLQSLNLLSFDTSRVISMSGMFHDCTTLTELDLSSFDTTTLFLTTNMFSECRNLRTIYVETNWMTANVGESNHMFNDCYALVGGAGTTYDSAHNNIEYARIDTPTIPGYFTAKNNN